MELSPELLNLVTQIATKNNITNYSVDIKQKISNEGDGYIGILNGLTVIDKDSDKKLSLVAKRAPASPNLRTQFPTRLFFLKEIRMYDEIFPDFFAFQEQYNIPNPFKTIPKLYGFISDELKETLLLENLKEDGYSLCSRQEPLDAHHLSLVVTEYAKLHALSHAMRKLQPERFDKVKELVGKNVMAQFQKQESEKKNTDDSSSAAAPFPDFDMQAAADGFFRPTMKAIEGRSPKVVAAVKKFKEYSLQFMFKSGEETDENSVICHGDCWSANLLFKYENRDLPKIPTKICLIDWQMSMLANPIHDLSYSLFINSGKKDLENYMRYLHIYHTTLSDTLTAYGLDPEEIYPFKLLEKEFQEKAKIGFFMNLVMLQQSLSEGKTHDFEELANAGKSIMDVQDRLIDVSDLFKQRMGDLVDFLVEYGFLNV